MDTDEPNLLPRVLRRLFLAGQSPSIMDYERFVHDGSDEVAVKVARAVADAAPSDELLCYVGMAFVEPPLSGRGYDAIVTFMREARESVALRTALSYVTVDLDHIDPPGRWELEQQLESLKEIKPQ